MKWQVQIDTKDLTAQSIEELVRELLKARGLKTQEEIEEFLHPTNPLEIDPSDVGINKTCLKKGLSRIGEALKANEPIVVYGDYDADGICATAILFEALRDLGASVMPFIPQREKEGYGLSNDGIDTILADAKYHIEEKSKNKGLLIAVDSGIVAHEAIIYAKKKGFDVVVIDHHEKGEDEPKAYAVIHTQLLCATGISFFVAKELLGSEHPRIKESLELAAIATITDLMPLIGPNRAMVKEGLRLLNKTERLGLRALFSVAGIEKVGTYEVGYLIGPRLNASGRIESALTALRMLCTHEFDKALEFAKLLNETNKERQIMTEEMTKHAFLGIGEWGENPAKIIVIDHDSYHQGVIGLIAGKLVEKYYLPAIVISRGESISRASARSVTGFNIIEAINQTSDLLLGSGGHPMAAGFSIETEKITLFKNKISLIAHAGITDGMLERSIKVDALIPLSFISKDLWKKLQDFAPFGMGNPEPVFGSLVVIEEVKTVGQEGKHLKLKVTDETGQPLFDGIAFNRGELIQKLRAGDKVKVAYNIDNNIFNGRESLQLKIKDIFLES